MEREVVDIIVVQDGTNKSFLSYMDADQANMIANCGGLSQTEQVHLNETETRPIPDSLKEGFSIITDVLVRLQPNCSYSLN